MQTSKPDAGPIVAIGACALDVVMAVDRLPAADERVSAASAILAGGGPAATAAVAARRLGASVSYAGVIGDDAAGQLIQRGLTAAGLDVSLLRTVDGARSALSVGLVPRGSGARSLIAYRGDAPLHVVDDSLEAACRAAAWVHVDHAGYAVVPELRRRGVDTPISVDGGNPIARLDLSLVDFYVPSASELLRWTGLPVLADAMDVAADAGPAVVIVTRGVEGSLARTSLDPGLPINADRIRPARQRKQNARVWSHEQPALRIAFDDGSTLGAGDVYHGALLARLTCGATLAGAMRDASIAAALACRGLDGRSAIPDLSEVRDAAASWMTSTSGAA